MSSDTQTWQPIDPSDPGLPGPIEAALSEAAASLSCLAMVVAPDVDPRWGADVSLLIARELSAKGRKIFLADASFERPVLHEAAGVANGEGISDVLLYGVSLRHVSEPIEGGVVLASTGTPVGDIQELLGHPNWETLIRGFDEAGVTILVHLPSETPGAQAFLDAADALIVLAADQEESISVVPEASDRVLAVMGPGAEVVEEPDVVEDMEPVEDMESVEVTAARSPGVWDPPTSA